MAAFARFLVLWFGKEIARIKRAQTEILFLCGILHPIGKPAILQIIANFQKTHDFLPKPDILEVLLEEYHWAMSTCMARGWNLPEQVQVTCSHYRNYAAAPTCQDEVATTYLADRLAS